MAKKSTRAKKSTSTKTKNIVNNKIRNEIIMIGTFVISLIIAVSIYTTQVGVVGDVIRKLFVGLLGFSAYLLPVYIVSLTGIVLFNKFQGKLKVKYLITSVFLVILATLTHVVYRDGVTVTKIASITTYYTDASWSNGGILGGLLGDIFINLFGYIGSYIILSALIIIYLIILTEKSFFKAVSYITKGVHSRIKGQMKEKKHHKTKKEDHKKNEKEMPIVKGIEEEKETINEQMFMQQEQTPVEQSAISVMKTEEHEENNTEQLGKNSPVNQKNDNVNHTKNNALNTSDVDTDIQINSTNILYEVPPVELLKKNPQTALIGSRNELLNNARKLEKSLESFGVKAKVVQVNKGPTVTRYELQPSQGVKVSKIVNLSDDIALNLAASGVRIEAPVPGKGVVGIEVANKDKQAVYLREVIDSDKFNKFPSDVSFGLGKDIDGNVVVADISKMPHLLIAGATGSGKSVCINTLITSILYKAHPKDVKLILIDPKVVELSVYNGIPHLLIPVVNDPKKAAGALHWAVAEMTTRYKKFADLNVRDIKGYNKAIKTETVDMDSEGETNEKMPHIVIIIDELADLMMVSPKDVEESICRLAQMARAAGIHLVIATQRPSVDVITGVIKANIPSRLAFAVSSGTDSRTILDMNGAEKLLGKGDMLFMPIGAQKPIRIQGAFISDNEVENIVKFIKKDYEVNYSDQVIEEISAGITKVSQSGEEVDDYLQEAIELVVGKQKASISMLQRTFRIGFNRAARLMEDLHDRGIVGPEEGSKPRRVLITKEQLEAMKEES